MIDTTTYTISDSDFKKTDFGYVLNFLGSEILLEQRYKNSSSYQVYVNSMDGEIPAWAVRDGSFYLLEGAKDHAESIAKNLWLEAQGPEFMAGYLACQHDWFKGRKKKLK